MKNDHLLLHNLSFRGNEESHNFSSLYIGFLLRRNDKEKSKATNLSAKREQLM